MEKMEADKKLRLGAASSRLRTSARRAGSAPGVYGVKKEPGIIAKHTVKKVIL